MTGKEVPGRYSGLRSSEKELLERSSGAFHHKNRSSYRYSVHEYFMVSVSLSWQILG
jgi:hypothetical protein